MKGSIEPNQEIVISFPDICRCEEGENLVMGRSLRTIFPSDPKEASK